MPKITSLLWKNRKNRSALGALLSDPLCLRRLGATLPDPTLTLSRYEFFATRLIINATFMWHEEKDSNILKLVSKSAAAIVTDINYCNL